MYMTRTATGLCLAAAFSLVATLGAQSSSPQQQPPHSSADHDNITVTGCLQKDASGSFILANAQVGSPASSAMSSTPGTSSSATGATGTTGTMPATPGATFKLEGSAADLDKHVGEKVQVTGKEIASSSSSSASTSSATAATGTTGTTGAAAGEQGRPKTDNAKKLDVQSVKALSSSCS
jgi:hypothetical protein